MHDDAGSRLEQCSGEITEGASTVCVRRKNR
jgi:hypothetical protein